MTMMIEFLIMFALGWFLGSALTRAWLHITFREILRDLGVTEQQLQRLARKNNIPVPVENPRDESGEITLTPIEIKIEQVGDMLYAYRLDNGLFLGQGTDRESLLKRLTENLTNVRLIIAEDQGAGFIKK